MSEPVLRARMLYLVGGVGNAERIDVSDLFAQRLAGFGLECDYVIYSREVGPAWTKTSWRGATAYVVGRNRRGGLIGAVLNKLIELGADLRTTWLALRGTYDLVQIRDKFVVAVLCLWAAKLRRIPYTYWMSYPYAEGRILDAREGRALMPALTLIGGKVSAWLLYRVILPRCDHVFVQSRQMLRDVAAQGIPEELMTAVPMAVSEDLLASAPQSIEPDTIAYLGTLIRVRRLEVLIEALAIVRRSRPAARLIFIGDGEDAADRCFLQERARALGVSDAVTFTGMLPMSEAHLRIARAAVCVSPFYPTPVLLSTSPTKLVEYMALGRAVVANDHPEQSQVLSESGAGLCVGWSAGAFAQALLQLLDDPASAEHCGARGRAYVGEHRIYPVIARRLTAHYAALLARSGREPLASLGHE